MTTEDGRRTTERHVGAAVRRPLTTFEIYIDELVLEGFSPFERYTIGEAVERELTRLFVEQGLGQNFQRDVAIESLDAGEIQLEANARGEFTGAQIAHEVYGALNPK